MDALLWLAVLCGLAGALADFRWKPLCLGNRTPLALLASLALCLLLQSRAVGFDARVWVLIDFAVIVVIASARLRAADWIVLALFVPAWAAYSMAPEPRYLTGYAVVVAQLVLTFPARRFGKYLRPRRPHLDPLDHFDLRVIAT